MKSKNSVIFTCTNCTFQSHKWLGKCSDCGEWNSLVEEVFTKASSISKCTQELSNKPKKLKEIKASNIERITTDINEFDRVVGGGLVMGSLTLIGGEPGIGKSTLLLDVCSKLSEKYSDEVFLYISGEESEGQIANRAKRVGISESNFLIYHETNWQKITDEIKNLRPKFVVLDSIQTTISNEIQSSPGSVAQIKEVTYELMNIAKQNDITCFVVGHINKEGTIAGPKILEHMVDTVIYFEGDQQGHYRVLRSIKNRFGNTNEIGIFEMCEDGLKEVINPAQYFINGSYKESFGRSLTCIKEGSRNLFIELQSLVVECKYGNTRRITQGVDSNKISIMIAIIEKYLKIQIGLNDIYVNVVGSLKLVTKDSDLSIIASILSSYKSKVISNDTVFIGEVGLTGEIRGNSNIGSRIKEMEQLNYKNLVAPNSVYKDFSKTSKLNIIGITHISELSKYI